MSEPKSESKFAPAAPTKLAPAELKSAILVGLDPTCQAGVGYEEPEEFETPWRVCEDDDISVRARAHSHGDGYILSNGYAAWYLEIEIRQKMSLMKFIADGPYLLPRTAWTSLVENEKGVSLRLEGGYAEISPSGDLYKIEMTGRCTEGETTMEYFVPRRHISSALNEVLRDADQLGLFFVDERPRKRRSCSADRE